MILSLLSIAYIIFYFIEGGGRSTSEDLLNIMILIYCLNFSASTYLIRENVDEIKQKLGNSDFNSTDSNRSGINGRLDKLESYIKNELRSIKNRIK